MPIITQMAATAVVVLFGCAYIECAVGEALQAGHSHGHIAIAGHGHDDHPVDAEDGHHHEGDSEDSCWCATMLARINPASTVLARPGVGLSFLIAASLESDMDVVPPAILPWDHGPPGQCQLSLRLTSSHPPRGPPGPA